MLLNIKKGLHDENEIILRSFPYQENNTSSASPIIFDAILLYHIDSDEDGIPDLDEGKGDWDKDEIMDKSDKDTVCIPGEWNVESDSGININICLDIAEGEGESPYFHDVRFLDQNALDLPYWMGSNRFLPYGILGFIVEGFEPHDRIILQIKYFESLYPSVQYHFYQGSSVWQEANFVFLDDRTITITLEDGRTGDSDEEHNGIITSVMAMTYPNGLNMDIKKGDCFINSLINF